MASFLGQSGKALNFLNPAGEQLQVDPSAIDQSALSDLLGREMYAKAEAGQLGPYQTAGGQMYDPQAGGFQVPKELTPDFMKNISGVPGLIEGQPVYQMPYSQSELDILSERDKLKSMQEQLQQFKTAGISNPGLEQAVASQEKQLSKIDESQSGDSNSMQIASNQAAVPERYAAGIFNTGSPVMPGMSPEIQAQMKPYQDAFSLEQAGIQKESAGAKKAAAQQEAELNKFLDPNSEYQRRQAAGMAEADQIRSRTKDMTDKYESMVNDFQKSAAVDPNRLWNNANTGGKIMAGISMLLGGLGAGLAGGPNQGLAMIDKMIDKDIDAQRMDLEKKKSTMGMQQNLVGMMRSNFGDNEASMMAAKRIALDNVEMQLKKTMAGLQGTQAEANGMKALGQLGLKKAELDMNLKNKIAEQAAMSSISNGGQITPQAALKLPKEVQDRMVKVGADSMAMAINPTAAKTIQDKLPEFDKATTTASDLLAIIKEGGASIPFTDKKAKADALVSNLKLAIKNTEGLGVLSATDYGLLDDIVGNPTGMFSTGNQAKMEEFLKRVAAGKKKFLNQNTLGYKPEMAVEKRDMKIPSEKR